MSYWNEQTEHTLTTMWMDGFSATMIAQKLGDVSRSAVIGKVHRMGIKRSPTCKKKRFSKKKNKKKVVKAAKGMKIKKTRVARVLRPKFVAHPLPARRLDGDRPVTLIHLTKNMCRWPYGDPQKTDFHYCGHTSQNGKPYCKAHQHIAHQPG